MDEFDKLLSKKTKLVAITHISNTLGTVNPIKEIIQKAHAASVLVLVDGSDLRPSSPVRRQYPRRCWEHPAGVVVTPKEKP